VRENAVTITREGKRVRKLISSSNIVTHFVYDAGGTLVEEWTTTPPMERNGVPTVATTSYVYAGSRLISTETDSGTTYVTLDHLGSTRVTTDSGGNVTSRKDFMAFGEEAITVQRNVGVGYGTPPVRKDYTGYEKEAESGLEFAQARFQNPIHGRFTSVDPLTASATIRNPQSFNRYTYALNSPYKFVDPLGLLSQYSTGACGSDCPNSGPTTDYAESYAAFLCNGFECPSSPVAVPDSYSDAVEHAPAEQITANPDGGQTRQTPADIQITVGELITYNGEPLKYPDGSMSEEKVYGRARINVITVLDEKGKPVEADSGVTVREDVKLVNAKPPKAKDIISISQPRDLSFTSAPGVIYDLVGPVSTNPDALKMLDKTLQPFSIEFEQTLTVKDRTGAPRLTLVNTIIDTNKSIDYKVGTVKRVVPN